MRKLVYFILLLLAIILIGFAIWMKMNDEPYPGGRDRVNKATATPEKLRLKTN
jgi:hypothetical protein